MIRCPNARLIPVHITDELLFNDSARTHTPRLHTDSELSSPASSSSVPFDGMKREYVMIATLIFKIRLVQSSYVNAHEFETQSTARILPASLVGDPIHASTFNILGDSLETET